MLKHIAFATDLNYSGYLAATLQSLKVNSAMDERVQVHVVHSELDDKILGIYKDILKGSNFDLNIIKVDVSEFKTYSTYFYFTPAVYFRIKLPGLIQEADRIVYIDSDTIIRKPLRPLFEMDLQDRALAAVENPFFERHGELDMPAGVKYFNSGVMVLNARKFREENLMDKVFLFAMKYGDKLTYVDQDALNGVLHDDWIPLSPEWNSQTIYYILRNAGDPMPDGVYPETLKDPAIVHFTTKSKPWHYMNNHPFRKEFLAYYRDAGFRVEFEDYSIRNVLKKNYGMHVKRNNYIDYRYNF
ncbi:MAG: glycosyltransferase family 8 protein [Bacteroidales bacterium]|nr:glycosyltransferase family 8 protein [Bacteroidales bacterium]